MPAPAQGSGQREVDRPDESDRQRHGDDRRNNVPRGRIQYHERVVGRGADPAGQPAGQPGREEPRRLTRQVSEHIAPDVAGNRHEGPVGRSAPPILHVKLSPATSAHSMAKAVHTNEVRPRQAPWRRRRSGASWRTGSSRCKGPPKGQRSVRSNVQPNAGEYSDPKMPGAVRGTPRWSCRYRTSGTPHGDRPGKQNMPIAPAHYQLEV